MTRHGGSLPAPRPPTARPRPATPAIPPCPIAPTTTKTPISASRACWNKTPQRTQREIAAALGISLGQTNFLLMAPARPRLPQARHLPARRTKARQTRLPAHPAGLRHRLASTRAYLARKTQEYQALQAELASLNAELGEAAPDAINMNDR